MEEKSNECQHQDIVIGSRGANCMQCGVFLYSQTGCYTNISLYKERSMVIATINLKEDQWCKDVVPFEYYDSLIKEEIFENKISRNKFSKNILSARKKLIDYIIELGDRFMQRNLTIHTAVEYLDIFFNVLTKDKSKFISLPLINYLDALLSLINTTEDDSEEKLNIWAIVSLVLASKYDEIDKRIPFYSEIIKASSRAAVFSLKDFHKAEEFFIKSILSWNFRIITTLHFTYNLLVQGILFEDDKFPSSQERILKSLKRKAELFTDLSLDSDRLNCQNYSKSKIGVSCIVAARKICEIKPLWNNKLYNMTGYHFFDIKDILEILIREYCNFFNEEYSEIIQNEFPKRLKMQQRPQSFINRRASEKPKLYGKLTHIQSAKTLKLSNGIDISTVRNTLCENQTSSSNFLLNCSGNNCDLKSVKLDACDGDTFSSGLSVPDENETETDTMKEFQKVDEKCKCISGNSDCEDCEPIKVYIMKFKSKNEHETDLSNYMSNPSTNIRLLALVKSEEQIQYRKSNCIEKPFERIKNRETINYDNLYEVSSHSKSSCKAKRVHDSLYNSNSKVISSKTRPTKCSLRMTKDVFKLLRKSMKSLEHSSLNETVYTSPKIGTNSSSNYLIQKSSRNNFKYIKRLVSNSRSRYCSNLRKQNVSYYKHTSSQQKCQFNLKNHRLVTEKTDTNYASVRGSYCESKLAKQNYRNNSNEETYFHKAKLQLSKYVNLKQQSLDGK